MWQEQVTDWFKTWDPDNTGKIPISKLEGPVEGIAPLTEAEIAQLKVDLGDAVSADGMWSYKNYLTFMVNNQNMKLGTSTF